MTLLQLKYAIAIAETGSLNKAAEQVYISQPSLTNSIKELEKELGVQLFYRNGHGTELSSDGKAFIAYAKQIMQQYNELKTHFSKDNTQKREFFISSQHYGFVSDCFVELLKKYNLTKYNMAIRETKTRDVIDDVASGRSELGIIYLSKFNMPLMKKILRGNNLEFTSIIERNVCVFIHKDHPLAEKSEIEFEDLSGYPCIMFDQGDDFSFYFAEEALSFSDYEKVIHVGDSVSILKILRELDGFLIGSGILPKKISYGDYVTIPYKGKPDAPAVTMNIGYIKKSNVPLSEMASDFVDLLKAKLKSY